MNVQKIRGSEELRLLNHRCDTARMLTLLSSKTALGRAVSPLTAVLPCGSMRPRVEHPEQTSLHDGLIASDQKSG